MSALVKYKFSFKVSYFIFDCKYILTWFITAIPNSNRSDTLHMSQRFKCSILRVLPKFPNLKCPFDILLRSSNKLGWNAAEFE